MKRKLRIGLDFDGVVAYNPARVIRAPITFFKRKFLGVKRLRFFVPKEGWQRWAWIIAHESSVFPAKGVELLKKLVETELVEVHLVTARYSFLNQNLAKWLKKHQLGSVFKSINFNASDEQPHVFKEKLIKKLELDFFVEDNLDIVNYLETKVETPIYWIYNIIDRWTVDRRGFANLEEALQKITDQEKNRK